MAGSTGNLTQYILKLCHSTDTRSTEQDCKSGSMIQRRPKAAMTERICPVCGREFQAKTKDVKRGWGVYCKKSCAAISREAAKKQHNNDDLPS
jgi:hypothetical protein